MPFVVMIAGAKSISEGGTALVFLANTMPGFLLKLSSPYWFDKVSYKHRLLAGAILMGLSFSFVAIFSHLKQISDMNKSAADDQGEGQVDFYVLMQLLGVAFCSASGDMGEASLLALSGRTDSLLHNQTRSQQIGDEHLEGNKSSCITSFASGTGLAGPLGFGYVVFMTKILEVQLTTALLCALVFPVAYYMIFMNNLLEFTLEMANDSQDEETRIFIDDNLTVDEAEIQSEMLGEEGDEDTTMDTIQTFDCNNPEHFEVDRSTSTSTSTSTKNVENTVENMSIKERLYLTLSFWPYMIPLFTVYASEYALQSGVWTAIGFPIDDESARNSFYTNSNWAYQLGVFVSRSTGAFCIAPMWVLWLMPILQCLNLVFFYFVAVYKFWYSNFLMILCFYVGLLGGSVYVNGYLRINRDLPFSKREFALSTVSVADSLGVVFADISGLFIQSCLYEVNGISGSVVSCPL